MTNECQAKGCKQSGKQQFIADRERRCKWSYFICHEHHRILSDYDKRTIARNEGIKQ